MKTLLSILILLLHLSAIAQSGPELFPVNDRKAGYLGYYLEDGTNVVKPQFCSASYYTDGYYMVSKAEHEYDADGRRKEAHIPNTERYGLLDSKGNFIIDFSSGYSFVGVSNGVIYVIKDNRYGTVNEKNEVLIPIIYEELEVKGKNWIVVKRNDKYAILNPSGKTIIPFQYDYFLGDMLIDEAKNEFLTIVAIGDKNGVINQRNQWVVPLSTMSLIGVSKVSVIAKKNNQYGLLDHNLKTILPFEFESLTFDEEKVVGNKDGIEYGYTIDGKLLDRKEVPKEGTKSMD